MVCSDLHMYSECIYMHLSNFLSRVKDINQVSFDLKMIINWDKERTLLRAFSKTWIEMKSSQTLEFDQKLHRLH